MGKTIRGLNLLPSVSKPRNGEAQPCAKPGKTTEGTRDDRLRLLGVRTPASAGGLKRTATMTAGAKES